MVSIGDRGRIKPPKDLITGKRRKLVAFTLMVEYGIGSILNVYHVTTPQGSPQDRDLNGQDVRQGSRIEKIDPTEYRPEELVKEVKRLEGS